MGKSMHKDGNHNSLLGLNSCLGSLSLTAKQRPSNEANLVLATHMLCSNMVWLRQHLLDFLWLRK